MHYDFAPLEGITDSIYRRLHHRFYPGIHRYFTPFLSPTTHRGLTNREQRELPPADTLSYVCVPQILTKNPEDFLWLAAQCRDLGYREVNLNLGCPSGTVTAKGKGSGMLRDPDGLDRFLEEIFSGAPIPISVKTRIGYTDPEEFPKLLEIYNRYPIRQLIIHPRVRAAFYNGSVDMDTFRYAQANSRNPLCYNGDILSLTQAAAIPAVDSVMIGRGLIGYPGMVTDDRDPQRLRRFLTALLEAYIAAFGSARNAMFRLKEQWHYLLPNFRGSEKLGKQLRKTTDVSVFCQITDRILTECPFLPEE